MGDVFAVIVQEDRPFDSAMYRDVTLVGTVTLAAYKAILFQDVERPGDSRFGQVKTGGQFAHGMRPGAHENGQEHGKLPGGKIE
jgi:hypothetical protein